MSTAFNWIRDRIFRMNREAGLFVSSDVAGSVGVCVDSGSRMTFLQADAARSASRQIEHVVAATNAMSRMTSATAFAHASAMNSRDAASRADQAIEAAESMVREIDAYMLRLSTDVSKAADRAGTLQGRSGDIEQIVQLISLIARQTSLLAMNAKIEAARAGVQGKGFSVVADAVAKLASQTDEATRNIQALIQETLADVKETREVVTTVLADVDEARQLTSTVRAAMQAARDTAAEVVRNASHMVKETGQVSVESSEVGKRLDELASAAEETSSRADQARESARASLAAALQLQRRVIASNARHTVPLADRLLAITEYVRGSTVLALNSEAQEIDSAGRDIATHEESVLKLARAELAESRARPLVQLWNEYSRLRAEAMRIAASGRRDEALVYTATNNRPKYQAVRQLLLSMKEN